MLPVDSAPSTIPEEDSSIDLREYLALFRQWWWLVVIATLVAGAAAYLVSRRMTPVYEASTTLLINDAPSTRSTADYSTIMANQQLAQTYAQLIKKRPVMEAVLNRVSASFTPDQLNANVTVNIVKDTQLITVSVSDPNPAQAALFANQIAQVFAEQVQQNETSRFAASKESLQQQMKDLDGQISQVRDDLAAAKAANHSTEIDSLTTRLSQSEQIYANLSLSYEQIRLTEAQSTSSVTQVEEAAVPVTPVSPKTSQNTLLAAVVGLMLAVGGIFAYDVLDDTVKNPEEVIRRFRLPVMGMIAEYKDPQGALITRDQPRSPVTESFRSLRTNVQYASVDKPLRSIMITSPAPSDGKTTIAANLGVVMAQGGRSVTVLDADLRRPRQHRLFQAEKEPGLSSLFVQPQVHLNGAYQGTSQDSLHVVTAGALPPNPSELLGSNKMREILQAVLQQSDLVLVDTPPVLSVTDAVVLSPLVDGVLLVVKPGATKMGSVKAAVEQLRQVGANLVGVIFNDVDTRKGRYGYYYKSYYYHHYYSSDGEVQKKGKPAAAVDEAEITRSVRVKKHGLIH